MKRFLSCVLSAMLLIGCVPSFAHVKAQDTPQFFVGSVESRAGKEVEVPITMANNPGITSFRVVLEYDSVILRLTKVAFKEAANGFNTGTSQNYDSPYSISGFNSSVDINTDGVIAVLTFEINANAETGHYPIQLSYDEDDVFNLNGNNVHFDIAQGCVQVEAIPISVTAIALNKQELSLKTGENETLIASVEPANATNKEVLWTCSDSTIATIDAEGKVVAVKQGTTTITATTKDGNFKDSCVVTVACAHKNTTSVPADPSTCVYQGHDAYTKCNDCNEMISGSDAKLPLENHRYENIVEAEHLKSGATCVAKAIYYKSCSVCGLQDTQTFEHGEKNNANHVGATCIKDDKPASCYEEGYTGNTHCTSCDAKLSNGTDIPMSEHTAKENWTTSEDEHWKECGTIGCGAVVVGTKGTHGGGEATCIAKAKCSVCGVSYGAADGENHKKTELRSVESATEEKEGYTGDTWCVDCEQKVATGTVIEKLEHKVEKVDAKPATCSQTGNVEYYTCKSCSKNYKDADGLYEIMVADIEVEKIEHETELKNAKEATESHKGYTGDQVCKICKQVIETGEEIPVVNLITAPQTGDNNIGGIWTILVLIALSGAVSNLVYRRKCNR